MKFFIKNLKENILTLTRKIGYHYLGENENTKETNFIRPLERSGYPRFHLYLKADGENLIFSLHLDQKKPIYKGTTAHSGEYDGAIVENEVKRIKQTFQI